MILFLQQLATQLKSQLEQAKRLAATNHAAAREEIVILTKTDAKGTRISS